MRMRAAVLAPGGSMSASAALPHRGRPSPTAKSKRRKLWLRQRLPLRTTTRARFNPRMQKGFRRRAGQTLGPAGRTLGVLAAGSVGCVEAGGCLCHRRVRSPRLSQSRGCRTSPRQDRCCGTQFEASPTRHRDIIGYSSDGIDKIGSTGERQRRLGPGRKRIMWVHGSDENVKQR